MARYIISGVTAFIPTRIWPSERRGVSASCARSAFSSTGGSMTLASRSRSPSRRVPGPTALTILPWWKPISAVVSPDLSVRVPVRAPRWMNCIASATETSSRFPERLIALLPAHQRDQALQRLQLAIGVGVHPRGEQRGGGRGRDQVEQVAILGAEHVLVPEEAEDDQRTHGGALDGERHAGERVGAVDGPDAEHAVGKRRVHCGIAARVDAVLVEASRIVLHALGERDLALARALGGLALPEEQDELLRPEQVDGDLGDGGLHLCGIERGMELVGGHVKIHQPADLLLVLRELGGQLLAVRLHVEKAGLQIRGRGIQLRLRLFDLPRQLGGAIERRPQLVERGPDAGWQLPGSRHASHAAGLAVSLPMTPSSSSLRKGFFTYAAAPACMPRCVSSSVPSVVMITTGMRANSGCAFTAVRNSSPFMRGMLMSSRISSTSLCSASRSSASRPS